VGDVSVGDVSVLPSDRRLIVESAAGGASDGPSSGEVWKVRSDESKSSAALTQTPIPDS
jgi:hypothetical protein